MADRVVVVALGSTRAEPRKATFLKVEIEMVEAAGVEPASENAQSKETTCVSDSCLSERSA